MDDIRAIQTLYELALIAKARRAVICPKSAAFNKPRPAAVMINLQGMILLKLFQSGMYVYEKGRKCE